MRQRKMKQRKSKQSKSLAKILTLGIAAATVVSSMSVPGGLLAPETVYADDNTGAAESGDQGTEPQEKPLSFDVVIGPNDSATVYVMQVTNLVNTDTMSYQYSINGTDYYPLQELQTKEKFGARQMVDLHVKAVGSDNNILSAGNCKIETPRDSEVPTISGTDKFSDRTEVTITTTPGAIVYYTTDDTVPTKGSQQYKTPITLTETTTIKAIAIEDGHIMSDVVGRVFAKESSGGSSSDGGTSGGSSSGGSSSGSSSGSGSSSSGSSTDSGSETAPPQEDNKDKTTTKTKTETREDGTVVTTTEIRAEDGSIQIRTEIRNEKTGMNIVVNVSKNAKGKITSATAEILDRGFGNVKISGEALSEIVKAAGTKKVKTTIKMLTKNDWVIREVTVNVNTLLKRTVRPKKMKIIEIDPETGEKLVVSKMPFRVAADGSVELDHNELGHGTYELVTADEEEALTKQIRRSICLHNLRSIKATKQSASIREKQGTYFWFKKGVNWDNVDKVTFSVLNPDVARVSSNGRITGLKPGKTVVKAVVRLENGQSKVIRMTVTVNEKK